MLYIAGMAILYLAYALSVPTFPLFVCLFFATLFVVRPYRAISPLTMLYVYYGLWYVVAPLFAIRYQGEILSRPEYSLALAFAYTVFGIGTIAIRAGEDHAFSGHGRAKIADNSPTPAGTPARTTRKLGQLIFWLYIVATLSLVLIVQGSGGLAYWLRAPGDAFLNRGGTGVYVIAGQLSSLCLAALSGYYSYTLRRKLPLVLFIAWLLVTAPVHGSKYEISVLLLTAMIPWLRDTRLVSLPSLSLLIALTAVFFAGLYFRNVSWIDQTTIVPYALNYFTALENLAISIRDFQPQFMMTFFLPFVKFMTPFGLSDPSMYFDMNHLLTDIYYPTAWAIRATEQWPVETDLYLNFFFFGGLPVVCLFLYAHGYLFGYARRVNSLGAWFASIMLTASMISHLRGSLYNHVDFYLYSFTALMFFALGPLKLPSPTQSVHRTN